MSVRVGVLFAFAALLVQMALPVAASASRDDPKQHWIGIWGASPLLPDPVGTTDQAVLSRTGFQDQTLREIVYPHFSGTTVRIRLANTYSDRPLMIGDAHVGSQSENASIVAGSDRQLTFSGSARFAIPPEAEVYSDPVALAVDPSHNLAISLYLPGPTGPITWHATARQTLYLADGDQSADDGGGAFAAHTNLPSWYVIDGVEVVATSGDQSAIVTFGDSITDGTASSQDANNRWPDFLARRLADRAGNQLSVVDEGIAGNRVLSDTPTYVNALARLDRDVLSQAGVRYVTLLEGINDIGQTCLGNADASADELVSGYRQIISQVHQKGLKIFGATMTPFKGAAYYCEDGEQKRGILNTWIRTSGEFDGVIDFDQATRDPADALAFKPEFDSGDHLHPNDAGYRAMADAVDLKLFTP
jgi:lysophospholipase L1-like esterase